jgi:hypothetical protein
VFRNAATSAVAARWLTERMATRRARPYRASSLTLRSALSLWKVPSRTLILHYHVLPDRTYLFRIARRFIDVRRLPIGRVHLQMDYREAAANAEQLTWLAANLGITEALADFPRPTFRSPPCRRKRGRCVNSWSSRSSTASSTSAGDGAARAASASWSWDSVTTSARGYVISMAPSAKLPKS